MAEMAADERPDAVDDSFRRANRLQERRRQRLAGLLVAVDMAGLLIASALAKRVLMRYTLYSETYVRRS